MLHNLAVPCSAIHDQIHARNRGEVITLPAEFWGNFLLLVRLDFQAFYQEHKITSVVSF